MAKTAISLKIDDELLTRLRAASVATKPPHTLTVTALIEHGAELALKELERKRVKKVVR